jgi:hypothetical protein
MNGQAIVHNSQPLTRVSEESFNLTRYSLHIGSNTKKPHTSIANVVSKPAVRPASLPEPATSKYIEDGHDIASPMEGDEDEQEQRRKTLLKPNCIPGVDSWGIPPEPSGDCDPDVEVRIIL